VEENCVRRLDPKGHLQRDCRNRRAALPAKAASRVNERAHLLVTRPVEPHLGRGSSDAAIHLGDGNGSPRLTFDLVEKPAWNAWREREHAARIAWQTSGKGHASVPICRSER
jgi:hypothetical protein